MLIRVENKKKIRYRFVNGRFLRTEILSQRLSWHMRAVHKIFRFLYIIFVINCGLVVYFAVHIRSVSYTAKVYR